MFNLFKKTEKPTDSKYPKEVMEIHNEFNSAADVLLASAKQIIDEASKKDVSKVDRLEKIGFKQANQVSELKPLIKKAELSKEQVEMVNYYQQKYPLNKFITEDQVMAICYKWNLVCGGLDRYKGFVPEKNLSEVERFKLRKEDEFDTSKSIYFIKYTNTNDWKITNLKESDFSFDHVKYLKGSYHYAEHMCPHIEYPKFTQIVSHFAQPELIKDYIEMKICAPIKDMDVSGLTLDNGYKLKKNIHVPDPVVLQPVKGGYLILTAWGDEASDENVVNQKMN